VSDSCFSGALFVRGETRSSLALDELEQRKSRWAFCSGRHDEQVYDGKPGENSPFTGSILQVLEQNQASKINIAKIVDEVIELTRAQYRQLPEGNPLFDTGHKGGQFVFRLRAGEKEAWAACRKENTVAAYQSFLLLYPDSRHVEEAQKSLAFLKEEAAWQRAHQEKTLLAYNDYMTAYPNGRNTRQALDAIRELEEETEWQKAKELKTLYAYRNYVWKYRDGKYKKQAEERIQAIIASQAKFQSPSVEKPEKKTSAVQKEKPFPDPPKPFFQQSWFRGAMGLLVVVLLVWVVSKFLPDPEPDVPVTTGVLQAAQDKTTGDYGYKDSNGQWAISPQFDDAIDFSENLAAANRDGLWGFVDRNGQEKIPFQYYAAERFSQGLAWVADKDRKYGYIDTTGETAIRFIFDSASHFDAAGEAWAEQDGKGFYINREGECIRECPEEEKTLTEDTEKPDNSTPKEPVITKKVDPPKPKTSANTVELDGQTYKTIRLNGKTWLAENLNYDIGEGSWCYDKSSANCREYGRLYTWQAARAACHKLGDGWRLPSDEEWKSLANSFGGYSDLATSKDVGDPKKSYKALQESSGFAARLGGNRSTDGKFYSLERYGTYWSDTEKGTQGAWVYDFDSYIGKLYRNGNGKALGFSCRCLKD
jgi:uncharacterized protein (TIGR02145 family)